MRKFLTFFSATLITGCLMAGGLVTNTNQSASWVRLPVRDASVEIDAVYYNPAGLMKLENGFHFSVSNQTIKQTKKVTNNYAGLNDAYGLNVHEYDGKVSAPVFPSVYAVYKLDKFAFSFGFNPIGGGGSATFKKGLPSFEISPSDLVPSLAAKGATAYRLDTYFKGTSVFFGYQGAVSYKINDMISIAAGIRYISAKNTYSGYLRDIELNMGGAWTRADAIMTGIATTASGAATSTSAIVTAGYGSLTLAQAQGAGIINATQRAQLEGGLAAFGSPTTVNITTADAVFKGAAAKYNATATLLGDQDADVEQTGSGITPVFSVNISPNENVNIAIKYEMATKIEVANKTTKDFTTGFDASGVKITMFPNGQKTRNDMPAMLSVGVDFKILPKLKASLGTHYYFDKTADYGHRIDLDLNSSTPSESVTNSSIIDKNYYELGCGLEYNISDKLLVSGGYLFAKTGVNAKYQSDLAYSLSSSTIGGGGAYKITDKLMINLGLGYTIYHNDGKMISHFLSGTTINVPMYETYYKDNLLFAVGVDFSF